MARGNIIRHLAIFVAFASIALAAVPDAPTGAAISAHADGALTIDWTAPADNGGNAITGYQVERSADSGANWTVVSADTGNTNVQYADSGLTNGTNYIYRISAINRDGAGAAGADSAAEYPSRVPDAPTALNFVEMDSQVAYRWTAPGDNGGDAVAGYKVEVSLDSGSTWLIAAADTGSSLNAYTASGLTNGTNYIYRISAINRDGFGASISHADLASPRTVPGAPTNVVAVAGNAGELSISWDAPTNDGGSSVSGYYVEVSSDSGDSWSMLNENTMSAATSLTAEGLTIGGAYSFRIKTINEAGSSVSFSPRSNDVVFRVLPDAPTSLVAQPGDGHVTLSWTAPADNGGDSVSGYQIEVASHGNGFSVLVDNTLSRGTTYVHSSVLNGVAYTYRVAARNSLGPGAVSAADTTTPSTLSSPPLNVAATVSDSKIHVSWNAPADNGGHSVSGYKIQTNASGTFTLVAQVDASEREFTFDATNGQGQRVRVLAVTQSGTSEASRPTDILSPFGRASAPTSFSATNSDGIISLQWQAPVSANGSPITSFKLEVSFIDSGFSIVDDSIHASDVSYVLRGYSVGELHTFKLTAVNAAGSGEPVFATVVPITAPSAPAGFTKVKAGDGKVHLSWNAPDSTGGTPITGYRIDKVIGGSSTTVVADTDTTATLYTVSGLTNGEYVAFAVAALNSEGESEFLRSSVVVPRTVPESPQSVNQVAGEGSINVTWGAPSSDGGASITSYTVSLYLEDSDIAVVSGAAPASARSLSFSDLENGTRYVAHVVAHNAAGPGPSATSGSLARPTTTPGAPRQVSAIETDQKKIQISWLAPSSDGGAPITSYIVEKSLDGAAWTTLMVVDDASRLRISSENIRLDQSYRYRVIAVNARGAGTPSSPTSDISVIKWQWYSYIGAGVGAGVVLSILVSKLFCTGGARVVNSSRP